MRARGIVTVARSLAPLVIALSLPAQETRRDSITLEHALQSALLNGPAVVIVREQVNDSRGARLVATSAFDVRHSAYLTRTRDRTMQPVYQASSVSSVSDFSAVQNDHLEYGVSQQRLLRSGITVAPRMTFRRTDLSTTGVQAPSGGNVSLALTLPLLRGRGGGMAIATERAADEDLSASELDLAQSYSDDAARSVAAYWRYLAAHARLEAVRHAEQRAARLLEETQALVRADERPASDLVQLEAAIAAAAAQRLGAEQSLVVARHALGLAMGMSRERFASIGTPATPFPALSRGDTIGTEEATRLIERAIVSRADVNAAGRRVAAAHHLVIGSERELRSRVDVDFQVGYAGIETGRQFSGLFSPFYRNVAGTNATLGVSIDLPGQFNAARGTAMRTAATEASATRFTAELTRRAASDIQVAIEAVAHSASQLERAHEATALYARALENERVKFKLGTTTLFDALRTEDALMQATLDEISANLQHADALAALRYQTGTLVTEGRDGPIADVQALRGDARRTP
jgi:outer membrane protein